MCFLVYFLVSFFLTRVMRAPEARGAWRLLTAPYTESSLKLWRTESEAARSQALAARSTWVPRLAWL